MPDGTATFARTTPGPIFEQTRNAVATIHYRNELLGRHPLPVDPTLDWANPNNFPKPAPPFLPFPPGYDEAQSPITHTTHTHGIEVLPQFDGTPDTWFTANGIHGPEYVSNDYSQPTSNQSAAFWYHDHSFGVTRLDVGMGLNGFSILRDPNNPLDQLGNSDILGFEDYNDWTPITDVTVGQSATRSQGAFSVALNAQGYDMIRSRTFTLTNALGSSISLDLRTPTTQPWGGVQLVANCPSKNVYRAYLSQAEIQGLPANRFNTLSFPVPGSVASSLGSYCQVGSNPVSYRSPRRALPRRERMEGHDSHACRANHEDPHPVGTTKSAHWRWHTWREQLPVRSDV